MFTKIFVILSALLLANTTIAKDLGYRFKDGKCVNEKGQKGLNPGHFGQCSDLKGVVLGRFNLDDTDFSGSDLTGADLQKSTLNRAILVNVNFESANLAGVQFANAQIKNSKFQKANLKNSQLADATAESCDFSKVDFSGVNLSYFMTSKSNFSEAKFAKATLEDMDLSMANLSGADFKDAKAAGANLSKTNLEKTDFTNTDLTNANFSEAKGAAKFKKASLTNANMANANFTKAIFRSSDMEDVQVNDTKLMEADLRSANLAGVKVQSMNLKGAMFNRRTVLPVTKDQAEQMGMVYTNSGSVLFVWDEKDSAMESLKQAMEQEGMEVSYTKNPEYSFDGSELTQDFDSVVHFNGNTFSNNMPTSGQEKLMAFVKAGGTFVEAELNGYETQNGGMNAMRELTLFKYNGNSGSINFTVVSEKKAHPLLEGVKDFTENVGIFANSSIDDAGTEVVMKDSNGYDAVAWKKIGEGTVVGFAFSCTYTQGGIPSCLGNKMIQRLYINAINFGTGG
jgi:uncharacterized protein YjbI with pentapeptide repeats